MPGEDKSLPADGKAGKYIKVALLRDYHGPVWSIRHDSAEERTKDQLQIPWALERFHKELIPGETEIIWTAAGEFMWCPSTTSTKESFLLSSVRLESSSVIFLACVERQFWMKEEVVGSERWSDGGHWLVYSE